MALHENKRGMYEYVLSKSIMLIFILGIVYVFYNFYNSLNIKSAGDVAESEAERIAKIIDDTISYTGIETEHVIILNNNLKVGQTQVSYNLKITDKAVVLQMENYPYSDIKGIGIFGQGRLQPGRSDRTGTSNTEINCAWNEIVRGGELLVKKTEGYEVRTSGGYTVWYTVDVTISSEACGDTINLWGEWCVGDNCQES
ncbi:MAG: hypothetical protein JXB14_02915 [Candidatus Altiarchaeota archaeon]|nr:hypothetical protein [Candidatus Altiarchaeota archaeon]